MMSSAVVFLSLGGVISWILVASSVWVVAVVLFKLWQYRHLRMAHLVALDELLAGEGRKDKIFVKMREIPHPASDVCLRLARHEGTLSWERHAMPLLLAHFLRLRRFLSSLELMAHIAPLLGLLGTVLGMIDAFSAFSQAGINADPSVFADGIWKALLTTAMGLAVAIPAMVAATLFDDRVHRHEEAMERIAKQLFHGEVP